MSVDFLRDPFPGEAFAMESPQTDLLLALIPLQPLGPAQYDFIAAVQADAGPLEALRAGFFLSAALVGLGVEIKIMSSADRGCCFIFQEVSHFLLSQGSWRC